MYYFGPWEDPDGALRKYDEQKEALHAGRKPRSAAGPDTLTVKEVVNAFLEAKQDLVDSGELSQRSWDDYKEACDLLVRQGGRGRLVSDLGPDDFAALRNKAAKRWGPHRLKKLIQIVRSVFKHGFEEELIDKPPRFGPRFQPPTKKTLRQHRAERGPRLFTSEELRKLIGAAGPQVKAMLLLAVNAGFGNADVGTLPLSALDLDGGWVSYPRPKTGVERRAPLWPESVQAIREALAQRPKPKDPDAAGLVFLTYRGNSWHTGTTDNPLSNATAKLLRACGIKGKGLSFYAIRHTFRTVADEAKDQPAADHIMGHEVAHMSSVYRERISDERLRAVVAHVRAWLYPPAKEEAKDTATEVAPAPQAGE
jgi:integrase